LALLILIILQFVPDRAPGHQPDATTYRRTGNRMMHCGAYDRSGARPQQATAHQALLRRAQRLRPARPGYRQTERQSRCRPQCPQHPHERFLPH
jgi:hypothetical protein